MANAAMSASVNEISVSLRRESGTGFYRCPGIADQLLFHLMRDGQDNDLVQQFFSQV